MTSLRRSGAQAGRMLVGTPKYIYCGFAGKGNLGDEAMFEAIRDRLDLGEPLVTLPGTPTFPLRLTPVARRVPPPDVVVGGGTLIGRYGWLDRVQAAGRSADRRMVTLGTGVEDPDWSNSHALTDTEELKRWAEYLRIRFDRVTVRGPRSAAALLELGVEARVVGDPGLLLAPSHTDEIVGEGDIVINLGASGPIWGTQSQVNSRVRDLARELIRRGFQIRLLVMWERDRDLAENLASELPTNATRLVAPRTPSDLVRELSGAHVMIGQRLHSVVAAAAAHTPSISLAYRSKCLDFQESIDRGRFALRTDALDTASLVDLAMEIADNRDAQSQALQHKVAQLKTALNTEIAKCRELFSLGRSKG